MKIELTKPQFMIDAEKTYFMNETKNKFMRILGEIGLALAVFLIVQSIYAILSLMFTTYFGALAAGLEPMEYVLQAAAGKEVIRWEYATPVRLIFELLMTILTVLIARFYQQRKPHTLGFTKTNAVPHYLIGMLLGFVLFSISILFCLMFGSIEISYDPSTFKPLLFVLFFIGWLFQGMAEEVICRGFIMVSVARQHSLVTAILFNSIFFAALHLGNPGIGILPLINLTLFGIFASLVFIKSGNIWLASAMHSIWNMVQGNFYGVLVSGGDVETSVLTTTFKAGKELFNGGDFGLEGGLCVTLTYIIGIIIMLIIPSFAKEKKTTAKA